MHIRNIPGRKSDVNDATWIADLLAHGLIRSSFVPPTSGQELRDLTRTRKQLVREIAQHTLRLQKTLETANVKLTSVLTDILGVSGRAILAALVAGESDPARLAALASDKVKASRAELTAALHGRVTAHHRFMLQLHLGQIAALEAAVRDVEARLGEALAPFRAAVDHLITMPGVSETVARVIVAEIGFDMTRFPSAPHLVSWAGLCPRLHESAGKRLSNRTRASNPWLKTTFVQAAWSAARKKTATSALSSCGSRVAGVPRKPSWQSPPRCLRPPTICFTTASIIATSAPTTSTVATKPNSPSASSLAFTISASSSTYGRPESRSISF